MRKTTAFGVAVFVLSMGLSGEVATFEKDAEGVPPTSPPRPLDKKDLTE